MNPNKKKYPNFDRLFFDYHDPDTRELKLEKTFDFYKRLRDVYGSKLDPEEQSMKDAHMNYSYFDAGTLPEVIIKPPKNSEHIRNKGKEIFPDRVIRNNWYNSIEEYRNTMPYTIDPYEYISRVYEIYNKSGKPSISTTRVPEYNFFVNPFNVFGKDRDMYHPVLNRMWLRPDLPALESELAHAFLFYTDAPTGGFSLPGNIDIKGYDGYERPGHTEYIAHNIIQPLLLDYYDLRIDKTDDTISSIIDIANDMNNNPNLYGMPTRKQVLSKPRRRINKL